MEIKSERVLDFPSMLNDRLFYVQKKSNEDIFYYLEDESGINITDENEDILEIKTTY